MQIAFQEHERDMLHLLQRHHDHIEEINKRHANELRQYQDEIIKLRHQQQQLLLEIQELKGFREVWVLFTLLLYFQSDFLSLIYDANKIHIENYTTGD